MQLREGWNKNLESISKKFWINLVDLKSIICAFWTTWECVHMYYILTLLTVWILLYVCTTIILLCFVSNCKSVNILLYLYIPEVYVDFLFIFMYFIIFLVKEVMHDHTRFSSFISSVNRQSILEPTITSDWSKKKSKEF